MQLAPIDSAGHKAVRGEFSREREEAAQDCLTMRMVGVVALDMTLDAEYRAIYPLDCLNR
jgi:hypothetical protein